MKSCSYLRDYLDPYITAFGWTSISLWSFLLFSCQVCSTQWCCCSAQRRTRTVTLGTTRPNSLFLLNHSLWAQDRDPKAPLFSECSLRGGPLWSDIVLRHLHSDITISEPCITVPQHIENNASCCCGPYMCVCVCVWDLVVLQFGPAVYFNRRMPLRLKWKPPLLIYSVV